MDKILSPLARTSRAARCFSTTSRNAAPGPSRKPRQADDFAPSLDIRELDVYKFDDPTSLGWLRLEKIREVQELFRKLEVDRPILQAQAKKFKPPTSKQSIRIRSTIDLSYPTSATQRKSILIAPIASLPLKGADATQRMKVIAGPRWTPGYPGRNEFETSEAEGKEGKDGWIKISEERFPDARTNRWNVGSMLEKLVEAANDPKSPLSASTPIDTRHLLARQAKKRSKSSGGAWRKTEAMSKRQEVIGGVRGFPAEWISQTEPASPAATK